MHSPKYISSRGDNLALSNLADPMDILDVVEDATTPLELMVGLNSINLFIRFKIDRTTNEYVRLKGTDAFGNIRYFKAFY